MFKFSCGCRWHTARMYGVIREEEVVRGLVEEALWMTGLTGWIWLLSRWRIHMKDLL